MKLMVKNLRRVRALTRAVLLASLGGCTTTSEAPPPALPAPTVEAVAAAPAPVAAPATAAVARRFEEALTDAANTLFSQIRASANGEKQLLVIDPLIDGVSGMQSNATRTMASRIGELVRGHYPQFDLQPFSAANVRRSPKVLVGTFTAVNSEGDTTGTREAYRICLALADLKSGTVAAKGTARAHMPGVDHAPTPYFQDSPAWMKEASTEGYVNTCQTSKPGDAIQPAYLDSILAGSLISDAIAAYDAGRYADALDRYSSALELPTGHQLRVFNGVYLANLKLGRQAAANDAFSRIVAYGLAKNRLAVKFLFKPGSTAFVPDKQVSAHYPMWMKEIARGAIQSKSCLEVIGHTSRSGAEPLNQRLSQLRADYIKKRLQGEEPQLAKRITAQGVGSRDNLVGTGKDDISDALDRRVVFQVTACGGGTQYY
ncbi:MAG TPA: OmpA family protein [Candidatus Deferrimicrobium sp.]|nr:OmpA family protein [Candidatus Deferrimicrobium sp.]